MSSAGHGPVAGPRVKIPVIGQAVMGPSLGSLVREGNPVDLSPVVASVWRRALAEDAGVFAPVAVHPATVQALAAWRRGLRVSRVSRLLSSARWLWVVRGAWCRHTGSVATIGVVVGLLVGCRDLDEIAGLAVQDVAERGQGIH